MSEREPSEEELRAALEEQMRRIKVQDVLLQTVATLINLGARRLGLAGPPEQAGERDLEQARLAIEGARALVPLLPGDSVAPVRDALSQLQVAFVQGAQEGGKAGGQEGGKAESRKQKADDPAPGAGSASDDDAERAKARSKIWTPPGT